jgi:hypothetical protein
MGFTERRAILQQIEEARGSHVVSFITSLRPGVPGMIADDSVRIFFDQLELLPSRPVEKLDIFLCSNGGESTVPWRLVALFREYADAFNVLIPYRAYSAATLLALGADEIVMTPFAELGPIDPSVSNEFNPKDSATQQRMAISVEDVSAYVNFIKLTVGITHEDELIRAIEILANNVHPLALGNVDRFLSQSRMIARKILRTHMPEAEEHTIAEIVENMASKLYFHGHPINRREAKNDLRLKVVNAPPTVEAAMWALYKDYEGEFQNQDWFNPSGDLVELARQQQNQPPQVQLPPQMPPQIQGQIFQGQVQTQQPPVEKEYELHHVMIESRALSSKLTSRRRYQLLPVVMIGQQAIKEDVVKQAWSHSTAP